jgi:histidyl-tRNA synthetase
MPLFARYGYAEVRVPTVEYRDLYRRERIGDLFYHQLMMSRIALPASFPSEPGDGGDSELSETLREVVLRPDMTTPLARMFVDTALERGALPSFPQRMAYGGQTFLDLQPRGLRCCEYRQVGIECVSPADLHLDLEVLCLACDGLAALGLEEVHLRIGHADLSRGLLASLGLDGEALQAVGRHLERLARIRSGVGLPGMEMGPFARRWAEELGAPWAGAPRWLSEPDSLSEDELRERIPEVQEEQTLALLAAAWDLDAEQLEGCRRLARLDGDPEAFFEGLGPMLTTPELRSTADALGELCDRILSLRAPTVQLNAASTRGIAYYTGFNFEMHTARTGDINTEVCGGGRYDALHRRLYLRARNTLSRRGGRPPPAAHEVDRLGAVGMAFGLERCAAALGPMAAPAVQVAVSPARAELTSTSFGVAEGLREKGLSVRWSPGPGSSGEAGDAARLVVRSAEAVVLEFGGTRGEMTLTEATGTLLRPSAGGEP